MFEPETRPRPFVKFAQDSAFETVAQPKLRLRALVNSIKHEHMGSTKMIQKFRTKSLNFEAETGLRPVVKSAPKNLRVSKKTLKKSYVLDLHNDNYQQLKTSGMINLQTNGWHTLADDVTQSGMAKMSL